MDLTLISDLHGFFPELPGGDLLIVAGDLTARDSTYEYADFLGWLNVQNYKKKIFIAGNHDNNVDKKFYWDDTMDYLCDSDTEFDGLKIWGSPWTKRFPGENPHCLAFTCETEKELAEKWAMIPDDVDILVTHSPPAGIRDKTYNGCHVGSASLREVIGKVKPALSVFGHIHEGYGQDMTVFPINNNGTARFCDFVNASLVNERYEPVNKPVRIDL